ncbi:elongator complex protein 5-like [Sinocyclocheilus rhinocerous]|uniref:Elongator complex protein 5 n=1 Tax=Sinocyclocheilus rhinocerous TaxID=307959 RepID=A0A673M9B4_9TELE|nr:PREDICTED: elongator complex protein 5-like [Sinocyclocheilus rhinocerous]
MSVESCVLQGAEAGGFILIQDTVKCTGRGLLKCFINAALKRGEDVHVLGFESPETEVCAGLDRSCVQKLHFHKGFPDPLGWTRRSSFTVERFASQHITQLIKDTQQAKASVLVVDSLSLVLRHHDPLVFCQTLQELRKGGVIKTIIGLLHSDLHQQGIVGIVCYLASTVISVAPANNERHSVAKTTRRTKSGKVMQEEEYFSVCKDATLSVQAKPRQPGHVQKERDVSEADPTSNLTFNLRLSEEERKAKEKVALPFVFSQEKKSALLKPTPGSGRIVYEPDDNDDFDEEDPDDDLDV